MEQFITWYCSEPRLALNRTVVMRFRLYLESLGLAAGTVNQRLAAVRRLAYEAADSGLLSPELAAGIRRVKGAKQLGARTGNWLTQDQARHLLEKADGDDLRSVRDLAMISVLVGCGLRRAELAALTVEDLQIRQGHWAIVDLVGKGGHVRTVPVPAWVKRAIDRWRDLAKVAAGRIFRAVSRHGTPWGKGISENVIWYVVRRCAERMQLDHLAPHDRERPWQGPRLARFVPVRAHEQPRRFEFTEHDLLDLAVVALKDARTGSLCADDRKPTEYVLFWDTSFNQAIGAIHAVEQRQDERAVLDQPSGRGSDLRE